ncbi:multidrug resistance-associated ABC transporter [Pluteus cervinus]|uniref:Multidrug resistance-associated ABC transporter n=1 Tax=Pluteus cervinus TaxID=181527 RepID=A0ACD3ANC7_9AGAR|nr:multidrug resistance-associated ABC transporter [Pluteus cervinus]
MKFGLGKLFSPAPPAPPGFAIGKEIPERKAPWPSRIIFHWLAPFLDVGYSRPLEKDDLWTLPKEYLTSTITDNLEMNFYSRCPPEKRPHQFEHVISKKEKKEKEKQSSSTPDETSLEEKEEQKVPKQPKKKYDSSLPKALHATFFGPIWYSGLLKLTSDTLKTTTPLVSKVLLTWLSESYLYYRTPEELRDQLPIGKPRGIGYGIGLAFAIFAMQEAASLTGNHYFQISMTTGLTVRTSIIGIVFRKALRLSGRARLEHSMGQVTTVISTDASRLDRFCMFGHNIWVAPIQLILGIGLLISNLGYSALVGLGVLILGFPLQIVLVKIMFKQRAKGVKITDTRVRLITEILQGIRLIKFYAWEEFYAHQIGNLRQREIQTVRTVSLARAGIIALVTFIPVLATILSFITYALSGHDLNVAVIFTSLQFFNVIRYPLIFLPFVLAAISDALVALGRISKFLLAEEMSEIYSIDYDRKFAVDVDGDFTWETVGRLEEPKFTGGHGGPKNGGKRGKPNKKGKKLKDGELPTSSKDIAEGSDSPGSRTPGGSEKEEEKPFELKNLKFSVPRGSFVAIVGRVGSGKSSVLQALIGEMRKTRGDVLLGGKIAYVPQTAWIKNATLRENVLFGQEDNEKRFREVIRACNLEHDIDLLPNGELTEIGERGINISGGQKARVSLARAAFSPSDIVLLDDPLAAVDAYVGKAILENCILAGPLADRTRILVTHSLHVLDKADYIYVVDHGTIIEQGTYNSLIDNSVVFSRLMEEYGRQDKEDPGTVKKARETAGKEAGEEVDEKKDKELMQAEERNMGQVGWDVYRRHLRFGGGIIRGPMILLLLVMMQASSVGNTLSLGFWTSQTIPGFQSGQYMALYAGLGAAQAILMFAVTYSIADTNLIAILHMFRAALNSVLSSPTSFFDTTPLGRILSRFSKDQDTLDNDLSMSMGQFLSTFSAVIGTVVLVFYTFPYLGLLFVPLTAMYFLVQGYYRRTSVETKRLDSILRSGLYASYSESLTGLATIRAYREQDRCIQDADHGLDLENRAYYMTISIQRWLAVRLDVFASILILGIGLFAAGFRTSISPAKIGVVLSYSLAVTQQFSDMVSQFAQNEQNMNAVERILYYTELESEGDAKNAKQPPQNWPHEGRIAFKDVQLAYRQGLPLVLKGVNFEVRRGEKVGVVGRTGAGKSSLLQALFRMVELQGGLIEVDGVDIAELQLASLRSRLALVPQDSTLFLGTLRENLDPQNLRTDAEMISVLQRAWLLPRDGSPDPAAEAKFSLSAAVGDEGSNFSAGEKQLLALCRALVKNSRIIILDEATSSVDAETDAKLQRTIQTEFASATVISIAHRLNTIAYCDRILVMDQGQVAEYDTVLNLFDNEGSIFRSLCNEANLTRVDILRIREQHQQQLQAGPSSS